MTLSATDTIQLGAFLSRGKDSKSEAPALRSAAVVLAWAMTGLPRPEQVDDAGESPMRFWQSLRAAFIASFGR